MSSVALPPIPWSHEGGDFGSVWRWETPHFVVTVNGDTRSCYYTIADKSAQPGGTPAPLADGQAATFAQTERLIRSTIGKAYDPTLGYGYFAGPLATTFTIATGEQADFGPYTGQHVEVEVMTATGHDTYTGVARVEHYDLLLDQGQVAVRIPPAHVQAIRLAGRTTAVAAKPRTNRTVAGEVGPACTGRPGFMAGTVEHTGLVCPVHEELA